MSITRRQLISGIAKASVPAAVAVTVGTDVLHANEHVAIPNAAVGLLYDATICIGCKACVAACAEANDTPPDTRGDTLHQAPSDLNDLTRNVIKLYKPEDGSAFSFVKRQCMHCLDPACAAGCPFQALHKDPQSGIVTWSAEECIGAATAQSRARITFHVFNGRDSIRESQNANCAAIAWPRDSNPDAPACVPPELSCSARAQCCCSKPGIE